MCDPMGVADRQELSVGESFVYGPRTAPCRTVCRSSAHDACPSVFRFVFGELVCLCVDVCVFPCFTPPNRDRSQKHRGPTIQPHTYYHLPACPSPFPIHAPHAPLGRCIPHSAAPYRQTVARHAGLTRPAAGRRAPTRQLRPHVAAKDGICRCTIGPMP